MQGIGEGESSGRRGVGLGEWREMGGFCSKTPVVEDRKKAPHRKDVNGREKEGANGNGERHPPAKKIDPAKRPVPERKQSRIPAEHLKNNQSHSQPLGKRTNFGYERDFKEKYTLGKLLGHGQFGYTYVAIEKSTGNKVAAKCIEKKQVQESLHCLVLVSGNHGLGFVVLIFSFRLFRLTMN